VAALCRDENAQFQSSDVAAKRADALRKADERGRQQSEALRRKCGFQFFLVRVWGYRVRVWGFRGVEVGFRGFKGGSTAHLTGRTQQALSGRSTRLF
jgi:hypothetical protein